MKLVASAVVHQGKVFTGRRHSDAISKAILETGVGPVCGCQGFVNEEGTFYDRHTAALMAEAGGQLKPGISLMPYTGKVLMSDDLW